MNLVPDAFRIFVADLDRAKIFYENTLNWTATAGSVDLGFLYFSPGGISVIVELAKDLDPEDGQIVGRFTGLSLRSENIHRDCQILSEKGVVFTGLPERQFWGGTLAHIADPDHNILTLVER